MAQFEYQVVEQAGGRASHLNERLMQLVHDGWEPIMMSGVTPNVSLLLRRPLSAQTAAAAPAAAQPAPRPAPVPAPAQPVAPRPTQPGMPPRPPAPQ